MGIFYLILGSVVVLGGLTFWYVAAWREKRREAKEKQRLKEEVFEWEKGDIIVVENYQVEDDFFTQIFNGNLDFSGHKAKTFRLLKWDSKGNCIVMNYKGEEIILLLKDYKVKNLTVHKRKIEKEHSNIEETHKLLYGEDSLVDDVTADFEKQQLEQAQIKKMQANSQSAHSHDPFLKLEKELSNFFKHFDKLR